MNIDSEFAAVRGESRDQGLTDEVCGILGRALSLGDRADSLGPESRLLGEIPEFDSMAVLAVITALEEHFGFVVDDDEISADTFETVGSLTTLVAEKVR